MCKNTTPARDGTNFFFYLSLWENSAFLGKLGSLSATWRTWEATQEATLFAVLALCTHSSCWLLFEMTFSWSVRQKLSDCAHGLSMHGCHQTPEDGTAAKRWATCKEWARENCSVHSPRNWIDLMKLFRTSRTAALKITVETQLVTEEKPSTLLWLPDTGSNVDAIGLQHVLFTPSLGHVRRPFRGLQKFFPPVLQRCYGCSFDAQEIVHSGHGMLGFYFFSFWRERCLPKVGWKSNPAAPALAKKVWPFKSSLYVPGKTLMVGWGLLAKASRGHLR